MTHVVIMAGGRGQRLHPWTERQPKPMLKVGGRAILEQVIDIYASQGLKDFTLCLGYMAKMIMDHLGDGKKHGINVRYVVETEPMGTAGALRLIQERPTSPFIVTNADVLTRLDVKQLLKFHDMKGCMATMCLALYQHQVPYGVADVMDDKVMRIREKPIENFPVSAGINVLSPSVLEMIPDDGPYDMPDLLQAIPGVAAYQLRDFWTDVGRWEDLARANQEWAMT